MSTCVIHAELAFLGFLDSHISEWLMEIERRWEAKEHQQYEMDNESVRIHTSAKNQKRKLNLNIDF